jgi:hypothetical protein
MSNPKTKKISIDAFIENIIITACSHVILINRDYSSFFVYKVGSIAGLGECIVPDINWPCKKTALSSSFNNPFNLRLFTYVESPMVPRLI